MLSRRLETVKLTTRLKIDEEVGESLFEVFRAIVNELLDYTHSRGMESLGIEVNGTHPLKVPDLRSYTSLPISNLYTRHLTSLGHYPSSPQSYTSLYLKIFGP